MLEDKLLVWKFKHSQADGLRGIYEKYKNDLLALAIALSNDKTLAEDIVHDVFVSFAKQSRSLRLHSSLKSYLATAVANRVRNLKRAKAEQTVALADIDIADLRLKGPAQTVLSAELSSRIGSAMAQLPYDQREVIMLHLHSGLKFKQIAKSHQVSVNTIQSRYRYGLDKLRSILNDEVKK